MRRTVLQIAAAFMLLVSAQVDPALVAHAEATSAGPQTTVMAAIDSSVPSTACLRLGACVTKTNHAVTPAISEDYPDGLQWNHDWISFKFSGNRVKFRLHF